MSTSFIDLGLPQTLCQTLSSLGFEEPTPIQTAAIPVLLSGRDVLGQAATGTGKTAAFALPLMARYCMDAEPLAQPRVLVLTPTRELCLQVAESFMSYGKACGLTVAPIYGGQEYGRQIRLLKRGVHVVVATPGRALDHINKGTLDLSAIRALVLDEADEALCVAVLPHSLNLVQAELLAYLGAYRRRCRGVGDVGCSARVVVASVGP